MKSFKLPYKIDEKYVEVVYNICKKNAIDLIVPLIDPELSLLAKYKEYFLSIGTKILAPDQEVCELSYNKYEASKIMEINYILHPRTFLPQHFEKVDEIDGELVILKPIKGSSSSNVFKIQKTKINDFIEIMHFDPKNFIIQEYINFDFEVTVDVFADSFFQVVEMCQRKRLKVRGGEVERALTIKDKKLEELVEIITKILKLTGVFNVQFFYKNGDYYFSEVNPRFGGGYPLSYHAGANFIEHIANFLSQKHLNYFGTTRYQENMYMLRYDNAIYTKELIDLS